MNNLVKLVLVGGLGYLAYKMFASSTDSTSETTPPMPPTIPEPTKYEFEQEARTPIFEASKYAQMFNNRYREGSDMPPSEVAGMYNPLNIL